MSKYRQIEKRLRYCLENKHFLSNSLYYEDVSWLRHKLYQRDFIIWVLAATIICIVLYFVLQID